MTTAGTEQTSRSTDAVELIVFSVAGILCGLKIDEVQEIKRVGEITPVHHAPDYVQGVINLRGQIVTVIDVRKRLNYPAGEIDGHRRIVVVRRGDENIGLLVDRIEDAVIADEKEILPPPSNISSVEGTFFTGVYKMTNALVAILDRERILRKEATENATSATMLPAKK
jgi:purine-binding chemotaxis protein CheW